MENAAHALHAHPLTRFTADEILAVRQIVNPVLQAEWDLRCVHGMMMPMHHATRPCKSNMDAWR
jgi:hypothetical protein